MLATIAVLFQTLKSQKASAAPYNESELGDTGKKTEFLGEPTKATNGASPFKGSADSSSGAQHAPHVSQREVKEVRSSKLFKDAVVSSTAGASAGAAILTTFDTLPGSVRPASIYSSMPLPPSLLKARDAHTIEKPRPNHSNRSPALDSVTPFFPSDQAAAAPQVKPKMNHDSSPSLESVPPFFPSDQARGAPQLKPKTNHESSPSLESVPPFFPADQAPAAPQVKLKTNHDSSPSLESVPPFFPSDSSTVSQPKRPPVLDNVTPFFSDEQGTSSRHLPARPEASSALNNVTPFFSDEQTMEPRRSALDTATPFFPSDRGSNFQDNDVSALNSVTPFFPSDRVNGSNSTNPDPAGSQSYAQTNSSRKLPSTQGRPSQFKNQTGIGVVKDSPILEDILSGPMSAKGGQMLAEAATKPQDQNTENRRETTEERLAARGGYVTAFNVGEAPSFETDFTYEGQDFSYAGRPAEVKLSPEERVLEAERKVS